jgi:hypothetical protein
MKKLTTRNSGLLHIHDSANDWMNDFGNQIGAKHIDDVVDLAIAFLLGYVDSHPDSIEFFRDALVNKPKCTCYEKN